MSKKICKQCGCELEKTDKFCPNCNKKVKMNIWIILIPLIILALLIVLAAAMPYLFPEGVVESEVALCNCFSSKSRSGIHNVCRVY